MVIDETSKNVGAQFGVDGLYIFTERTAAGDHIVTQTTGLDGILGRQACTLPEHRG